MSVGADSVGVVAVQVQQQTGQRSPGPFASRYRATSVGIALTITLFAFEAMAVATAMPTAVGELDGLAYYGWPFSAFLVLNIIGLVVAGQWGDRSGARAPLLTGVAIFTAGLITAGAAPWMWMFVLGRGLQGLGSGMAIVAIFLIIGAVYPSDVRPRVFGVISAAWVLPALIGPVVAGALTTYTTWRLAFLGLVPLLLFGGVLLLPALRRLPVPADPPATDRRRMVFAVATGAGVAILQYAGTSFAAGSDVVAIGAIAVGAVLLVVGLRYLLPSGTGTFRTGVPAVVGLRGLVAGAFFAVESVVPLALATIHGYSPTEAGLPLMVGALGWSLGSQIQARLPNVERRVLLRWGFSSLALGIAGLVIVAVPGLAAWAAYPLWILAGFGMGFSVSSTGVLVLDLSAESDRGRNSAALQISDVASCALCVGLGGTLIAGSQHGVFSLSVAVSILAVVMTALALAGAMLSGRARPRDL